MDWQLARRDLLKRLGLGAACLPLLQATRSRAAPASPGRLMVIELTQGYRQLHWRPAAGALAAQTLPDSCSPFEPHKQELIFLPELAHPGLNSTIAGHYGFAALFAGAVVDPAMQFRSPDGPSLDQVVAAALPRPPSGRASLTLGVQLERAPRATPAPQATRCFWAAAGQPIDPVADPNAVYAELFAGSAAGDTTAARRLMVRRKSILDYVGSNLEDFKNRAGTDDRATIGAHLQSIRDLEVRLQGDGAIANCGGNVSTPIDLANQANYGVILDAHLRLMVAALKCGVTNVAALQVSDASGTNINFGAFVPGVPPRSTSSFRNPFRNWHDLGHNPVQGGIDHKRIVDKWFMARIADLLAQLKALPEGNGTFLDSTLVVVGNPMQEGANHASQKQPWILAGNCRRSLDTGKCLVTAGATTSGVMAVICDALGVPHGYGPALAGLKRA